MTTYTWYNVQVPPLKNYRVCLHDATGHGLRVQVACPGIGTAKHAAAKWRDLNVSGPAALRAIKEAQVIRNNLIAAKYEKT